MCEPSGYCSFDDADCESGRRYGSFAGQGLSGACVPALGGSSTGVAESTSVLPELTTSLAGTSTGETTSGGPLPSTDSSGSTASSSGSSSPTGSGDTTTGALEQRVEDGLSVLYRFDEGRGKTIHDTSAIEPPIDLVLEGTGFAWQPGSLRFTAESATLARSTTSVTKVHTACQAAEEVTLEAWVTPHDLSILGPPRIVTYSLSAGERNFSLLAGVTIDGTDDPAFRGRLRVSDVDGSALNGVPSLAVPAGDELTDVLVHVAFVHDAMGAEQFYLDGALLATGERIGSFASWDTEDARLVVGNELTGERAIDASLHLVAIYCRALSHDEVLQNLDAGP